MHLGVQHFKNEMLALKKVDIGHIYEDISSY